MKLNSLPQKMLAEFIGVTLFLTAIVGASNSQYHAMVLASTLALAILFSANISGGHLNPVVSLYFFSKRALNVVELLAYWVAQLLGGIAGVYLAASIWGTSVVALPVSYGTTQSGVVIGEIVATTVLVVLVARLAAANLGAIIPVAVGFWVFAATQFTATGAQANPAVTFALMVRDGFGNTNMMIVLAEFIGLLVAILLLLVFGTSTGSKKPAAKASAPAPAAAPAAAKPVAARKPAAKKAAAKAAPKPTAKPAAKPAAKSAAAKKPAARKPAVKK